MARLTKTIAVALSGIALAIVAAPSCDDGYVSAADCDYAVRRCSTYCDYYSSSCYSYAYGCCYDRCWYECVGRRNREPVVQPQPSPPPSSAIDAGTAPAPDGGDFAVLCAACTSNDDCGGGGLCIQRGGDAGGSSFCGSPCVTGSDCPAEFTCTDIGQTKQCVPTSGTCL